MATKRVAPTGADYTSLAAWQSAEARDLTGLGPEIVELEAFTDTTPVTLTGWVTTAADYIEIRTPLSHRHTGTAGTGYQLNVTQGGGALVIGEAYVRVIGLDIVNQHTGGAARCIDFTGIPAQNDIRIEACLLHDCGGYALNNSDSNLNLTVMNTAIYNAGGRGLWPGPAASQRVLFCSIFNCAEDGIKAATEAFGTISVGNGTTSGLDFQSSTTVGAFNISSDVSANSATSLTNQTAAQLFRNVTSGTEDLRLRLDGTPGDDLVTSFPLDADGNPLARDFRDRPRALPCHAGWWESDISGTARRGFVRGLARGIARGL